MITYFRRRKNNFKNYISYRNYGEHGGKPNPEHFQNRLSKAHRADVLYNKLAYIPEYANKQYNQRFHLIRTRLYARLRGLGRLFLGKFIRLSVLKKSKNPYQLIKFSLARQLTLHL